MKGKPCVLALICLVAMVAQMQAQESQPAGMRSGAAIDGRYFGFVPKHERILQDRNIQVPVTEVTSSVERQTRTADTSAVLQASYEQIMGSAPSEEIVTSVSDCGCVGACTGTCRTGPIFQLWGGAEYLNWSIDGADYPSLATTSPDGTAQDAAGVLPNATTLFGGSIFDERSGGRYRLGMWLNPSRTAGLEVSFLSLDDDVSFARSTDDQSILARPFFNADINSEDARLIAFPDLVEGTLAISAVSDFESFNLQLRKCFSTAYGARSDLLFGYRRASLDEAIRIVESTTSLTGATQGTSFDLFDQFVTENEFHGGEFGLQYEGPACGCWTLGLLGKVAFGNTQSRVAVSGQTTTTSPTGDVTTNDGGLLTQQTNIGTLSGDEFSTLAEFGITLRRQFQCGFGISIGYSLLHWSEVAMAGDQIDRNVNPTQIPPGSLDGPAVPALPFARGDFTAHGITAGLEYSF